MGATLSKEKAAVCHCAHSRYTHRFLPVYGRVGATPTTIRWKLFAILTTTANKRLATIHGRMPVIVAPQNYERWLDTDSKSTPSLDLLQPYPAEEMEAWTVTDDVGNVHNNDPELLALQEPDQGILFS